MEPILYGILGRVTSSEERSAVIAQHMLARELGLIFGPILNMGFDKVDYQITEEIVLNKFTMPGSQCLEKFGCPNLIPYLEIPAYLEIPSWNI